MSTLKRRKASTLTPSVKRTRRSYSSSNASKSSFNFQSNSPKNTDPSTIQSSLFQTNYKEAKINHSNNSLLLDTDIGMKHFYSIKPRESPTTRSCDNKI